MLARVSRGSISAVPCLCRQFSSPCQFLFRSSVASPSSLSFSSDESAIRRHANCHFSRTSSHYSTSADNINIERRISTTKAIRMFIQVQETPNPMSLKFLPGQKILSEPGRTYEFTSAKEATKRSPLARDLLRIDGVRSVFYGEDFVSVQKDSEDEEWALLKPLIFAAIMDHLQSGRPVMVQAEEDQGEVVTDTTILPEDDEVVATIKELLESRIKPMVQEDGGDVLYAGFADGVLQLRLKGSCTGCPSSAVTLKQGIKNMMQFYVPEVKDVQEVPDPEQELAEKALEEFEFKLKRPPK